jgi:hypothetical protein
MPLLALVGLGLVTVGLIAAWRMTQGVASMTPGQRYAVTMHFAGTGSQADVQKGISDALVALQLRKVGDPKSPPTLSLRPIAGGYDAGAVGEFTGASATDYQDTPSLGVKSMNLTGAATGTLEFSYLDRA